MNDQQLLEKTDVTEQHRVTCREGKLITWATRDGFGSLAEAVAFAETLSADIEPCVVLPGMSIGMPLAEAKRRLAGQTAG